MRPSLTRSALWSLASVGIAAGTALAYELVGPSSSQTPYVVPTLPGVHTVAILTVGDSVNSKPDSTPYRMVGIPDGLGAFDNGDGTFTLLMNHELRDTQGIVRAHGARGAFVSRWTIDKKTLQVLHGEDLMQRLKVWNGTAWTVAAPTALSRFCSADLPDRSAYYDAASGTGFNEPLFMDGEENGTAGNAYAHGMDGTSWRLPWLGHMSFENVVARPGASQTTVVATLDDDVAGQVYFYVGQKSAPVAGDTPVGRAGLTNGVVYGIKVSGYAVEPAGGIPSGASFTAYGLGDISAVSGPSLQATSHANAVTEFNRPEDGTWDAESPNDFYFVTTASFTGNSRLWRLRFADSTKPWLGGTIDMLLDGSEGQHMFDNVAGITRHGQVFLQEDPGSQAHVAKLWRYDIRSATLTEIAQHDPARFATGGADFLTIDEESSGIVDVSDILGPGTFLLDVQAHYARDGELVEGGQLLLMKAPADRRQNGK